MNQHLPAIIEKKRIARFGKLSSSNIICCFFFFLLLLICPALHAQKKQDLKITGKVTEALGNTALGYATVQLYKLHDSTPVATVTTAESGNFTLEAPAGTYYALVEFIGYTPFKTTTITLTPGSAPINLGVIQLISASKTLEEVYIQAEKSSMELSLDKKIFNVGKDLANAGGTAADILSNIPSVAVDVEGNVSLRGSNSVRILIDGKPSGLVSIKGGSGLQQLQGSMIEKVEIITNPSARYEAEGMGGIINIVLKKERKEGFNGSFDVEAGYQCKLPPQRL